MPRLIVAGSGIKSVAHLTEETRCIIQKVDKVLYLLNEDNMKRWVQQKARQSESLENIYFCTEKRAEAYRQITEYIVAEYRRLESLCVLFYGHPTVFAESALEAVRQIHAEQGAAIVLPAVSFIDCLFADLAIDPGDQGCSMIDATELLVYERMIDIHSHLIICQPANLGMHDLSPSDKLGILFSYLKNYYLEEQPLCIYEASALPAQKPGIQWTTLRNLKQAEIKAVSTLYIPPIARKIVSRKYLDLLRMDPLNFR